MEALSQAFEDQWKRSNKAEAKLENTLGHFTDLHKSLVLKDNITIKLQDTNDQLRTKVNDSEKKQPKSAFNFMPFGFIHSPGLFKIMGRKIERALTRSMNFVVFQVLYQCTIIANFDKGCVMPVALINNFLFFYSSHF